MEPSSRTPEGQPNRCPVCGKDARVEPSIPPGDAPCPHCGHLLWFDPGVHEGSEGLAARRGAPIEACFRHATNLAQNGYYDYATKLLAFCVLADPGNLTYVQDFVVTLRKKYGNKKKIGILARFRERGSRGAIKEAVSHGRWDEALKNSLAVLKVNPWDVSTLTAMATSYRSIANEGGETAYSRFHACSLFCLKCAEDASR